MEKIPTRILRKVGFNADSQGIINRYIHVGGAWDEHLTRTKNFVLKTLAGKKISDLAVLGSGWLLDLPIDELAGMVGHVWLYDLVHPSQIIHRLQQYSNVTALKADITGGVVSNSFYAVREYKRHGLKTSPEELCSATFQPKIRHDFIISLNILSQLGQLITDYLKQNIPYNGEETDRVVFLLQQSHLQLLSAGRAILVTDVQESAYSSAGKNTASKELIKCPLPITAPTESWEWQFDPLGEYVPGTTTTMKVRAYQL
jgi:hypothetical protein